jgi:hypothetical protein
MESNFSPGSYKAENNIYIMAYSQPAKPAVILAFFLIALALMPAGASAKQSVPPDTPAFSMQRLDTFQALFWYISSSMFFIPQGAPFGEFFSVTETTPGILFQDDFSSGSDGWTVVDEGTTSAPSNWQVANGVLSQTKNTYSGGRPEYRGTFSYAGDIGWEDYNFSVRINSSDNDFIGVMFRYQDQDNYYRLSMLKDSAHGGPETLLVKKVNGEYYILKSIYFSYSQSVWHSLTIIAMGPEIIVFFDGNELMRYKDQSLASGKIALYCWANDGCNFDDAVVSTLPCTDADGDRHYVDCAFENDCDDTDAGINPSEAEACGNNIDENCDGSLCAADFWAKTNTHGHSTGDSSWGTVNHVNFYKNLGYNFIVLTNHNVRTACEQYSDYQNKFWCISGEEYSWMTDSSSGPHVTLIDIKTTLTGTNTQNNINKAVQQEGIVFINHPQCCSTIDLSCKISCLRNLYNYTAIEILNAAETEGRNIISVGYWDDLLIDGRHVFGVGSDDAHKSSEAGEGWIKVFMHELSAEEFKENIRNGLFYASNGVSMDSQPFEITCDGSSVLKMGQSGSCYSMTIRAIATPELSGYSMQSIQLFSAGIKIAEESCSGSSCSWEYTMMPSDGTNYYRLEAIATDGTKQKRAYGNPIWVTKVDNPCAGQPDLTSCMAGKCCAGVCQPSPSDCTACKNTNYQCVNNQLICGYNASGALCTDDGNFCTEDSCDGSGNCIHLQKPSGTACTDDGNECTNDVCDGTTGCTHPLKPTGTACTDDSNACTYDTCNGFGICTHPLKPSGTICATQNTCSGTQLCTSLSCSSAGQCTQPASCTECPDTFGACGTPFCSGSACGNTIQTGANCGTTNCLANFCVGNTPYTYPPSCSKTCNALGSCADCTCTSSATTPCGTSKYCSTGACISCSADSANCDLNPSNGCEINLKTNANNCGSCGNSCGQNTFCNQGSCGCTADYGNCDSQWNNGCETNLKNNGSNCGSCGNTCPTGICSNSACVTIACNNNADCGTNGWVGIASCSNNDTYQNYRTHTCNNPGTVSASCSYSDTLTFKQDCGDTGFDSWNANYCDGNIVKKNRTVNNRGCSGGACFLTNTIETQTVQVCSANQQCSSGSCVTITCSNNTQCGTNGWVGSAVCSNNDTYQNYTTYTCNNPGTVNAFCSNSTTLAMKQDCGDTSYSGWNANYCSGNNVAKNRTVSNRGCSSGSCFLTDSTEVQTVQTCPNGCLNGACNIACSTNAQCGTNGWVGSAVCSNNDTYQNYTTYTCNNPGTVNAFCSNSTTLAMKQDCGDTSYGSWGSNYCIGNLVKHNRTATNRGCSGGTCFITDTNEVQTVQNCSVSGQVCSGGTCITPNPCAGQPDLTNCGTGKCCAETCMDIPTGCTGCKNTNYQCSGNQLVCGYQPTGTACTDDSNACTYDTCNGFGVCTHPLKPSGTICATQNTCSGTQLCTSLSCSSAGQCTQPASCTECPDTYGVCGSPTCSNNACGNTILTGTACGTSSCGAGASGSCQKTCSGLGACTACTPICSEINCTDRVDNDGDSLTDGNDSDCNECVGKADGIGCSNNTGICCNSVCAAKPISCPECKGSPIVCSNSHQAVCSIAAGTTCSDEGKECTNDICDSNGNCTHELRQGECLINNICYANNALNPFNSCQKCSFGESWSDLANSSTCDDADGCTINDTCSNGSCSGSPLNCGENSSCFLGLCICDAGFIDCDNSTINGCETNSSVGCPECFGGQSRDCTTSDNQEGIQNCANNSWGYCTKKEGGTSITVSAPPPAGGGGSYSPAAAADHIQCTQTEDKCCPGSTANCTISGCNGTKACNTDSEWGQCAPTGICENLECIFDSDCSGDEQCIGRICTLQCNSCQILLDDRCIPREGGICCNGIWNEGFESCSLDFSEVNILLQAAPSDYVKSLIENASASLQEGNVIKANAELLAATVNIKIALATLQGLDTKETTEQLSNAMASLEHGNYSSAMFYLNKANSSLTAMAQSFWAFLELIITIAVLVPVSVLLKK